MESFRHCHLLIGAFPPPIGGTTVLFEQLARELSHVENLQITTIDTSRRKKGLIEMATVPINVIYRCILNTSHHDSVGFHGSINGIIMFTPVLYLITRVLKKKLIIRTFGGNFDITYDAMSHMSKFIFKLFILNSDLVLFETKKSVHKFSTNKNRIEWYPNSRPSHNNLIRRKDNIKRAMNFVFLGHVKKEKGIVELVEAFKRLNNDVRLHIYGPISEDILEKDLNGSNYTYKGIVAPQRVGEILSEMDVLILPTYYPGEGYPGAILEAYANGLPVIATKWRCIPEIVHSNSGILVKPQNIDELVIAIDTYSNNETIYKQASASAIKVSMLFSSEKWTAVYVDYLRTICNDTKATPQY